MDVNLKSKSKKSRSSKHRSKRRPILGELSNESKEGSKELHAISFYINDRQEMISQMFSTMTEEKIRLMLPPELKGETMDELRTLCLETLLGLSSKRIKSVMQGEDLGSQSSDTESDVFSISSHSDNEKQGSKCKSLGEEGQPMKRVSTNISEGQSLLEIVEMQLRARAIRAALQCVSEPSSPKSSVKQDHDQAITTATIPIRQDQDYYNDTIEVNKKSNVNLSIPSKSSISAIDEEPDVFTRKGNSKMIVDLIKKKKIIVGPSKKQKNKIVYSKKTLVVDSAATNAAKVELNAEEISTINNSNIQEANIEESSKEATENLTESDSVKGDKTEGFASESWTKRWLDVQQSDVNNVVQKKTSKILTTLKQNLRKKAEGNVMSDQQLTTPTMNSPPVMSGTVVEYENLPQCALSTTTEKTEKFPAESNTHKIDVEPIDDELELHYCEDDNILQQSSCCVDDAY